VKNTLIKRAGIDAGISKDVLTDEVLSGQTAIIISEGDAIAPIQIIGKFAKEFSIPQFKVGIVEGSFQDKDSLTKLSNLPNKDILLSQFLGYLMSP
ncbi:MAG: 50S ribosomal protein L10, partial [Candidatus Woesebacteria bacterium]|nr:50S ribosomal protein L10 [Candidatus Woesebacteria bacterium]